MNVINNQLITIAALKHCFGVVHHRTRLLLVPYSLRISSSVVLVATFSNNAFSLEYRADLGLLIGQWLQALPPLQLQGTHEAMLAAAKAHDNCRFWLLDLRRRPMAGLDLNGWFREQLSPQIASALGGPLFTAYLAGPHQRFVAESAEMELHLCYP